MSSRTRSSARAAAAVLAVISLFVSGCAETAPTATPPTSTSDTVEPSGTREVPEPTVAPSIEVDDDPVRASFRSVILRHFDDVDQTFVCAWYHFGPESVCTRVVEVSEYALGDGPQPGVDVREGMWNSGPVDLSGELDESGRFVVERASVNPTWGAIHRWRCNVPAPSVADLAPIELSSGNRVFQWSVVDGDLSVDLALATRSDIDELCALGVETTIEAYGAIGELADESAEAG